MARLPRLDLPGVAQHIVQRGNDRQACFADDVDYLHYRQELGEAALKHGCALHAYVLMTNHVHLLVTPVEAGAVSKMMQAIGRRYENGVRYIFERHSADFADPAPKPPAPNMAGAPSASRRYGRARGPWPRKNVPDPFIPFSGPNEWPHRA